MNLHRRRIWLIAAAIALVSSAQALAADVFRYPAGTHGRGELKFIDGIPVLLLEGAPAEMGEQLGILAYKPAIRLLSEADKIVAHYGWQTAYRLVLKTGNFMVPRIPKHHLEELDATAKASRWPRDMLVFGNTILDLRRIVQCSSIIVEGDRTNTGGPLFGRNLDWPPVARLQDYTLVVVSRPEGKRAFASITFPGVMGCVSGMNDAGLAIAMLDSNVSSDGSPGFNPAGIPTVFMLRRLLEECSTVDEATDLMRSVQRASLLNLAMCDKQRGVVLEITPKTVAVRGSEASVCLCTNHFRTSELAASTRCWRYDKLASSITTRKLSLRDIAERLHSVNQGEMTLQSMVFEPATLELHLAYGDGPASRLPMSRIRLLEFFARTPHANK